MEGETVIAGVDTHKDVHVLCLLDGLGRKIWSGSFGADPEGYDRLAEAIGDPGSCMVVGVEGTASYGAGLTRRLVELGYNVVEVLRPKRDKVRPGEGKSDPLDAERAARKAASGKGCSVPKSQDGWVEAVRQLYVARRLAVATSTSCVACAKSMLTTAPSALRERFRGRERPKDLMPLLARGRKAGDALEESVLASLRSVAAVWKEARSQVESLDERIRALLEANAPALLGVEGCGTTTAAALVVAAGDNPGRLKGEAAFSMMRGASPIPASSGKTDRHRLNRGGNRQANWALYEIAIKRIAYDERTRRYVARRTSEGKSRREAVRCLKRYIAREVYRVLMDPNPRRRRAGRPRAREDAQGDAGDSEESRRGARPVRSHARALGTGETAVDETGEEVLRAPVRIGESAPANCLLTTYRSVGFFARKGRYARGFRNLPHTSGRRFRKCGEKPRSTDQTPTLSSGDLQFYYRKSGCARRFQIFPRASENTR